LQKKGSLGCPFHFFTRGVTGIIIAKKDEDILDRFIAVFDEADIRPEIRDELWNAIAINVKMNFFLSHFSSRVLDV